MPMITVDSVKGKLSSQQRAGLAERLTHVILEIEGGADTPASRSIAWVKFREIDPEDWYVGGKNDNTYVSATGKFLVELNVPEGSLDQDRKTRSHRAITDAFIEILGLKDEAAVARSVWVQIFEWPEGHLSTSGRTASLLGIAKMVGIPPDNPLLDFPRAYFDAKERLHDQAGFPEKASGRTLVRY